MLDVLNSLQGKQVRVLIDVFDLPVGAISGIFTRDAADEFWYIESPLGSTWSYLYFPTKSVIDAVFLEHNSHDLVGEVYVKINRVSDINTKIGTLLDTLDEIDTAENQDGPVDELYETLDELAADITKEL